MSYKLVSKFEPMGDQPEAIKELVKGIHEGKKTQVLLGGDRKSTRLNSSH